MIEHCHQMANRATIGVISSIIMIDFPARNSPPIVSGDNFDALPIFRTVFTTWSTFFIFFIIPLELLFRIDALLNYLPPTHILFNGLFVMLLYLALSCGIAVLSFCFCACLRRLKRDREERLVIFANIAVIVFGFVYKLLNTSIVWVKAVAKRDFDSGTLSYSIGVFAIVAAVVLTATKPQFTTRFAEISLCMFRPIIATAIIALLLISAQIATTTAGQASDGHELRLPALKNPITNQSNVILITLDALTANDMSLYGYPLRTTPNLEAFSKQCYIFEHAYANSNFTSPGIVSILTSKYPATSKIYNYYNYLSPEIRRENLAHELKRSGYETVALFANPAGHPNSNGSYRDFDQAPLIDHLNTITGTSLVTDFQLFLCGVGFHPHAWFGERLWAITRSVEWGLLRLGQVKLAARDQVFARPSSGTLNLARQYLRTTSSPFFLWIHLQAPHSPYLPTELFKYRFLPGNLFATEASQRSYSNMYYSVDQQSLIDKLRLRYDEHIASTDAVLGGFLKDLAQEGYQENSIIIIAADHGEQFEKGYHEHGGAGYMGLYQPLIHIPLLIHLPGQTTAQIVSENAEQVDIAPTILNSLNLPVPGWMEGESLMPSMLDQRSSGKPKFSMNLELCSPRRPVDDGSIAVLQGSDKYIYYVRSGKAELFDLVKDPHEEVNLAASFPDKAKAMNRLALQRLGLK